MATMPEEFKSMIEACNKTVSIMGNSLREITQEEYDQSYDEKKCYIKSSCQKTRY